MCVDCSCSGKLRGLVCWRHTSGVRRRRYWQSVGAVVSNGSFVDKSLQGAPWGCLVRSDLRWAYLGVGVVGGGSNPLVWRSWDLYAVLVGYSPDLGVAVHEGRCVGSLEVRAARVQFIPAEQAWPPIKGPPEP
jgi:hypothetical protein